jgi:hypothetical protein
MHGRLDDLAAGHRPGAPLIKRAQSVRRSPFLPLVLNLLLCLAIYAVGAAFALRGDPLAFARSGAAATAACVGLSLWDVRRILAVAAQIEREALLETVDDICRHSADAQAIAATLDARLRGRFGKAERFTTAAEAALLVIATLVWGFGDLLFA